MKKIKKASFLVLSIAILTLGFGQALTAQSTFNIGDCEEWIANPGYPFLYVCPTDLCYYSSTMYTCTNDADEEVPIYYRNPDCDNYYCIFQ